MKRLIATTLFAGLALVACVTVAERNAKLTESATFEVRQRAAFELPCSDEISVRKLNAFNPTPSGSVATFGAAGCGKRAVYVVECNPYLYSCVPVLNSETTAAPPPDAAANTGAER